MLNQAHQEPEQQKLNWQWNAAVDGTVDRLEATSMPSLSKKQINLLVKELASASSSRRDAAEFQLQALDFPTLLCVLAIVRKSKQRYLKLLPGAVGFTFPPLLVNRIFHIHMPPTTWVSLPPLFLLSYIALRKSHKAGAVSLARFENVESAGELISALEIPDESVQLIVRPALIPILRRVKSSDARLLDDASRRAMRRFLMGKLDPGSGIWRSDCEIDKQLAIALLSALQQIGDSSFIQVVTSLADSKNQTISREVSDAAKECLRHLNELVKQQANGAELLRGSQVGNLAGADTLLRPVTSTQDLHEAELLRATDGLEGTKN